MQVVNAKINVIQLALTFKGSTSKRYVESKGFHLIPSYGIGQNSFKNDSDVQYRGERFARRKTNSCCKYDGPTYNF